MTAEIKGFVEYLEKVKEASNNTVISYQRDLTQLASFLENKGITEVGKVTKTSLNSYILELEKEGKAFVFAPSKHLNLGTFSKDAALEQKLYDLGVFDYKTQSGKLLAFLQK